MRAMNEIRGEFELCAKLFFFRGHLSVVCLVIVSSQVENAVEHENTQFFVERVIELSGLFCGGVDGDGEVACKVAHLFWCGEREDVGWFVFAAELFVELFELLVICEKDGEVAFECDCFFCAREKTGERRFLYLRCGGGVGMVEHDHLLVIVSDAASQRMSKLASQLYFRKMKRPLRYEVAFSSLCIVTALRAVCVVLVREARFR